MHPKQPENMPSLEKAEWVAEAVRLSIEGWSCREIGKAVGRHHSTVAEALAKEFERVRPQPEEVETLRAIQREQIQRQMQNWIPRSLDGDPDAAMVVYRFMERAAKLDGLNAKEQIDLSGSVALTATAHDELLNRLSRLASSGEEGSDSSEPDA